MTEFRKSLNRYRFKKNLNLIKKNNQEGLFCGQLCCMNSWSCVSPSGRPHLVRYLVSYVLRLRVRKVSYFVCVDHRYDNFIVGLTNIFPTESTVTLWNYDVCRQYSGAVRSGTTVSVYCEDCIPQYRYVIIQLPLNDHLIACEVEVLVRGTLNVEYQYSNVYYSVSQLFNVVISAICRRTPANCFA